MLKRCNMLCHSLRVKFCFARVSASWFSDSTYLMLIFGSRLILSNSQSKAIRWVLDTCLIVGLLSLMIIFILASYNCDSFSESNAFERIIKFWWIHVLIQYLFNLGCTLDFYTGFPCAHLDWFWYMWVVPITSSTKSHKSSEDEPSIRKPASNEMISDSVELWNTDVCFLHIQLIGASVRLPKIHKTPFDVHLESSRSPAKSESWNSPNRQCWVVFPMTILTGITREMNVWN